MKNKCINCKHIRVQDREFYDSNNVKQVECKYICAFTGLERDIMCFRACEGFVRDDGRVSK